MSRAANRTRLEREAIKLGIAQHNLGWDERRCEVVAMVGNDRVTIDAGRSEHDLRYAMQQLRSAVYLAHART